MRRLARPKPAFFILLLLALVALAVLVFAGLKLWRAYQQAMVIRDDLYAAKALMASPIDSQTIQKAGYQQKIDLK